MLYNELTYNDSNTSEQFNTLQGREAIKFVKENKIITSCPHTANHVTSIKWQVTKKGQICNIMMTYVKVHGGWHTWENFI